MDPETFEYVSPQYEGMIINFTPDFILVEKEGKYGLINRQDFKVTLPIKYDNLVFKYDQNQVIGSTFKGKARDREEVKVIPLERLKRK